MTRKLFGIIPKIREGRQAKRERAESQKYVFDGLTSTNQKAHPISAIAEGSADQLQPPIGRPELRSITSGDKRPAGNMDELLDKRRCPTRARKALEAQSWIVSDQPVCRL
jgi:hypothetical protein